MFCEKAKWVPLEETHATAHWIDLCYLSKEIQCQKGHEKAHTGTWSAKVWIMWKMVQQQERVQIAQTNPQKENKWWRGGWHTWNWFRYNRIGIDLDMYNKNFLDFSHSKLEWLERYFGQYCSLIYLVDIMHIFLRGASAACIFFQGGLSPP